MHGSHQRRSLRGLALDIDDTLSWTVKHYIDLLQTKFGNPENLSPIQLVDKYRYTHKIPYWQTPEALRWIEKHIQLNETQEAIPLLHDSNIIVKKINDIIPVACYLTTRPDAVLLGTKRWLARYHFPDAPVIARPRSQIKKNGHRWKAEFLESVYPEVVGIVDDNPELIKQLSSNYRGTVFLYGSLKSPKTSIDVVPGRMWTDILEKIKIRYGNRTKK